MNEPISDNQESQPLQANPWNGVTLSMLIAVGGLTWLGYHIGIAYGWPGGVLGVILGIAAGILVTPFVFLFLIVFMHLTIQLEDYFKRDS